jgi:hypothetical protein
MELSLTCSEITSLEVIAPVSVLGFFIVGLKKASRVRFLDMMTDIAIGLVFRLPQPQNLELVNYPSPSFFA